MTAAAHQITGVPTGARPLAAVLSSLFDEDRRIVRQLNDAMRRARQANDQLTSPRPQMCGADRCGSPAGPVLEAIHWQIHQALCDYQQSSEQRRQLAYDVGELAQQLTETLVAAGWSPEHARAADVHQLARGETGR